MQTEAHSVRTIPPMRVVVFREQGVFVAECVDYSIAAHGDSPESAMEAFGAAVMRYVLAFEHVGRDPFRSVPTGSSEAREKWDESLKSGECDIRPLRIPSFQTRRRNGGVGGNPSENAEVSAEVMVTV